MEDRFDPNGIARMWRQAADDVTTLHRADEAPDSSWNSAVTHAEATLSKEAEDALAMGRMAYYLIVGNVRPDVPGQ
jgi:hypothetical protein